MTFPPEIVETVTETTAPTVLPLYIYRQGSVAAFPFLQVHQNSRQQQKLMYNTLSLLYILANGQGFLLDNAKKLGSRPGHLN
jgi:hypothetical protein